MDITLDQANRIIALALQRSAEAGYKPMAVVVLDASGHTRSAQRQDGASMFRIDIATGKAWASIATSSSVACVKVANSCACRTTPLLRSTAKRCKP